MVLAKNAQASAFDLTGHHEPASVRVRVLYNREFIADTKHAELVWEHRHYPVYYIPFQDVKEGYLVSGSDGTNEVIKGVNLHAEILILKVGENRTNNVHRILEGDLKDFIRFDHSAMDGWYEEDAEMISHPKDPYKRLDIFPSTKHVLVKVDGVTIAESNKVLVLVETLTPIRYYLPKSALNWKYVQDSDKTTTCPYKGTANYYSIVVDTKGYENAIWWYRFPVAESLALAGHVSFYNEKVDIYVDGCLQSKPVSRFSAGQSAYTA